MSVREDWRAFLLGDPDVAAALGDRLYPYLAPQGVQAPFATFLFVGVAYEHAMTGPAVGARAQVQLDLYARDYEAAWRLADACRVRLDGHRGPMGATLAKNSAIDAERDGRDEAAGEWRISQDYTLSY